MAAELHILQVVPITKSGSKETLSYFTAQTVGPGAIVEIPLRSKLIAGLVVETARATDLKSALRQADHKLKKIKRVRSPQLLTPAFIAAAQKLARWQAHSLGAILSSVVPQAIWEQAAKLEPPLGAEPSRELVFKPEIQVLEDSDDERLSFYKALIREEFARGNSLFLCVPTAVDLRHTLQKLGRGISEYTASFHSRMSRPELRENWQKVVGSSHPILIIGTPPFLAAPRPDLKTIILDRENSSAYKTLSRPFTDFRFFARLLAAESGARLILGDLYPRTETLYEVERKNFTALASLKQRCVSTAESEIGQATGGEVISPPVAHLLEEAIAHSERSFLLANRRGFASLVVCEDCGTALACPRCDTPMVLHEARTLARPVVRAGGTQELELILLCHHCNHRETEIYKCPACGGWRLRGLGTGIEKVAASLAERFPKLNIFKLDSDSTTTPAAAQETIEKFLNAPGSVLVGTEKAAHYLTERVENVIVVAADAQFSLPDFRLHERLFALLTRLRGLATKRFYLQTRYHEEPLFELIRQGNLIGFYRAELAERERFGYPPFKRLIKITLEGSREAVRRDMAKLERLLASFEPVVYPSFHAIRKGKYRLNLLLKIAPDRWPQEELIAVLRALPPSFIVNVEPEDIL